MRIQKYSEFVNEEISKKQMVGGVLAGGLALGALGAGAGYLRDRDSSPTEKTSSIKKELPNKFLMNQKMLTVGCDFYLTNDSKENFGMIEQRILSFGTKFEYLDNTGNLSAVAESRVISLFNVIDVKDANGKSLGRIEEEILETLGNILEGQNVYSIYDGNGNLVAKSKRDMLVENHVEIEDMSGKVIAIFHKPVFSFMGDRWKCEIYSSDVDPRLLIFIPSYISTRHAEKEEEKK